MVIMTGFGGPFWDHMGALFRNYSIAHASRDSLEDLRNAVAIQMQG